MISAVTTLSLGVGTAMAQSYGPSDLGYLSAAPKAVQQTPLVKQQVPAGSSDMGRVGHVMPFNGDFGDLANPG
jgi:hypothetical protein